MLNELDCDIKKHYVDVGGEISISFNDEYATTAVDYFDPQLIMYLKCPG